MYVRKSKGSLGLRSLRLTEGGLSCRETRPAEAEGETSSVTEILKTLKGAWKHLKHLHLELWAAPNQQF